VNRLRDVLAYRSAFAWRAVVKRLPAPRPIAKPGLDLTYLTIGGRAHLDMIVESLLTLARAWPRLPRACVVSDGSLDAAQLRRRLAFWRADLECLDWQDLLPSAGDAHRVSLERFAARDAMGRKLVAITGAARRGPVFYADADVLWFRAPGSLPGLLARRERPVLAMSRDLVPAYDPQLLDGALSALSEPPFYCAGVLFAHGDLLAAMDVSGSLELAARAGIGISEQTILAGIDRHLGGAMLPGEEIALLDDDRFSLGPSFPGRPWAARHYVGQVRHLYWRDALALRLGVAKHERRGDACGS
jgi:hypothetical protein